MKDDVIMNVDYNELGRGESDSRLRNANPGINTNTNTNNNSLKSVFEAINRCYCCLNRISYLKIILREKQQTTDTKYGFLQGIYQNLLFV